MAGKRGTKTRHGRDAKTTAPKESEYLRRDLESGQPSKDHKYRFRDHGNLEPDDQRREEFKQKLLSAVDNGDLEKFRKSDEEVYST